MTERPVSGYTRPAAQQGLLAELADAVDSKSTDRKVVPVRFRGGPPTFSDVDQNSGRGLRAPHAVHTLAPMPGPHALVVDDDEDIRESLCDMLSDEGYRVTTAVDGSEALRLLAREAEPFDVMLLDLRMPNTNGHDVLAAMRVDQALPEVPVVVLSANLSAVPAGAVAFLRKPVQAPVLLDTLGRYRRKATG